jgi:5'-phosphate synthase pdxT subunit
MMKMNSKTVGILAFQGGVIEHAEIIRKLGHFPVEVRKPQDLSRCDALIIPGGESTTIGFFLKQTRLDKLIKKRAGEGFPILGTCAGAILLAKNIIGNIIPPHLGLLDITVRRNAYGRQVDSFYADVAIPALNIENLHAAFIRAPIIEKTGPGAKILGYHRQGNSREIVLVQQGKILAATFHPELRGDGRLHKYFLSLI